MDLDIHSKIQGKLIEALSSGHSQKNLTHDKLFDQVIQQNLSQDNESDKFEGGSSQSICD
jgi:hypothetical protein